MDPPSPAFLPVRCGPQKKKKKSKPAKRSKHRRSYSSDRDSTYGEDRHIALDDSSSYDEFDYSDIELTSRGKNYCSEAVAQADDAGAAEAEDDDAALVKRLYQGPKKCKCCINWCREPPKALQRQRETAKDTTTRNAVVLRYSTIRNDFGLSFPLHSIVVQSQQLKDLLYDVLKTYPGINIGRKDAVFYPPFQPLVHIWDDLSVAINKLDDETAREHARAFCDAVEPEISDTIRDRDDLVGRGLITFDLLWTLYKPDDFVFCDLNGKMHLMQVQSTATDWTFVRHAEQILSLNLKYTDFNGYSNTTKFFYAKQEYFSGSSDISRLECVPRKYHPDGERLFAELVDRGKKTVSMMKSGCKMYCGHTISRSPDSRKWIEGRIFIDPKEYYKMHPVHETVIHPNDSRGRRDPFDGLNMSRDQVPVTTTAIHDDEDAMSDEQLAMRSPIVRGFSLSTKTWAKFDVDCIPDVEWNDNAFDQLVMPGRRKRLIKALVDKNQGRCGFDDFIKGKGQGLVMLLQGPPGTGKTLTAESIADRIHLPLYSVNAGEFHIDAVDIETTLHDILQRAAHWNAVLLIDEADAFLEKRSDWDMERNRRVAVFLRLLEYFKGVLILTTNRAVNFDPAFHSRIHLHLRFNKLDESARASVWKNFLRSIPNNVHEPSVANLAEIDLNGRQIKNVVKMAALLAQSEEQTLGMEHMEDVLEVMETRDDDEVSLGSRSVIEED